MTTGVPSHGWVDGSVIIAALENQGYAVQARSDGRWQAQYPSHDDHNPSLSISLDGEVYCFAGCDTSDVLGLRDEYGKHIAPRTLSTVSLARATKKLYVETANALRNWAEPCANNYASSIAERYASRRWGLTRSDAEMLELGYDEGLNDSNRPDRQKGLYGCPRLIIPLRDPTGEIVSL